MVEQNSRRQPDIMYHQFPKDRRPKVPQSLEYNEGKHIRFFGVQSIAIPLLIMANMEDGKYVVNRGSTA
jgi:hypothetical protein